jgi:hypothetical protein
MKGIKKFKVDAKELSPKEKALFDKLIKAAELIVPLYLKQKNNKYPGANFYPHDATKEEIEREAKKTPAILDPYTFVERDKSGKLIAVPYHIKFQKELKPVAKLLEEAARLSDSKNFSWYLKSRADSLLNGDYDKSDIVWLKTEPFKFGFVIGPIERYLDKLFFTKCAYQSWVGILDKEETNRIEKLKRTFLAGRRKILPGSEKVNVSNLGIRIDKTVIFSGLIADFMFTGTNLPNDVKLMEKYGSNLTIFETSLDLKFREDQLPIFKTIFEKNFQKSYSNEELYKGSLRCIALHEISHSLIRYRDAEERLKGLFPIFDELFAYILGIKGCGTLLLKDAFNQKELEVILIMHICRNFTWWLDSLKNPNVYHYVVGAAMAQNFFMKECAIKEKNGISLLDFTKIVICISELSSLLEYHLALGSYDEAKKFIEEYGSFDVFKRFTPKLVKTLRKS